MGVNVLCKLQSVADVTGADDRDTERETVRAGTSKAVLTPPQCWVTFLIFLQSGHPA